MADAAFSTAFANKDVVGMKLALTNGATQVNIKDDRGATPLHGAVASDDFEFVKKLVEVGADVNAKTIGRPRARPISQARSGKVAQYLIDKGATLGKEDAFMSPLELSLRLTTPDVARVLLNAGASPDEIEWGSRTLPNRPYTVQKSKDVYRLGLAKDFCDRGVARFCSPSAADLASTKFDIGVKAVKPVIGQLVREHPELPEGMAGKIASYVAPYKLTRKPSGGKTRHRKNRHNKRKTLRRK